MICMIDNYDSFTYNLVQILQKNGFEVGVYKNYEDNLSEIIAVEKNIEAIVISPGPGTPDEAGISRIIVDRYHRTKPILGVCLGHQVMAEYFGAKVIPAKRILHGRTSDIHHLQNGVYQNVSNPFSGMRYNSLIVANENFPDCLEKTAWSIAPSGDKEIMGFRHRKYHLVGIQYHPESVLSEFGEKIVMQFF